MSQHKCMNGNLILYMTGDTHFRGTLTVFLVFFFLLPPGLDSNRGENEI